SIRYESVSISLLSKSNQFMDTTEEEKQKEEQAPLSKSNTKKEASESTNSPSDALLIWSFLRFLS
ncbi:MAG: hypothetical protein LIO93_00980, partial [Bacteroidales bacterium]|nr:hypothetical protein [Bacteroidales bacterium]